MTLLLLGAGPGARSAGGGIVPIAPTDLTGLIGWWDTSVFASMSLFGATINSIADQSGNGNHLNDSMGFITTNPAYNATGFNGSYPTMVFGGNNTIKCGATFPMGTGNTLTFFWVGTISSTMTIDGRAISYGASGASHDSDNAGSWAFGHDDPGARALFIRNNQSLSPAITYDTPTIIIGTIASGGAMTLYIDGVATTGATAAGSFSNGTFGLGHSIFDNSSSFIGTMSEIGVSNGYHDATVIAGLRSGLQSKWGM